MENSPNNLSQIDKAKMLLGLILLIYAYIGIFGSVIAFWIFTAILWIFTIVLWRHRYIRWKENRKNKKGGWQ
jgi:hypothetical protein